MASRKKRKGTSEAELKRLALEIAADLSEVEPAQSKELLSDFVSELFLAMAEQKRKAERRQKQAEGIAAAKARGVRFGRPGPDLPENFDHFRLAWREGQMSAKEAAEACGMSRSAFYYAAASREQSEDCAG